MGNRQPVGRASLSALQPRREYRAKLAIPYHSSPAFVRASNASRRQTLRENGQEYVSFVAANVAAFSHTLINNNFGSEGIVAASPDVIADSASCSCCSSSSLSSEDDDDDDEGGADDYDNLKRPKAGSVDKKEESTGARAISLTAKKNWEHLRAFAKRATFRSSTLEDNYYSQVLVLHCRAYLQRQQLAAMLKGHTPAGSAYVADAWIETHWCWLADLFVPTRHRFDNKHRSQVLENTFCGMEGFFSQRRTSRQRFSYEGPKEILIQRTFDVNELNKPFQMKNS